MYLSELQLQNYRGFRDLSLIFSPGVNLLFGVNGAGKSSVLDAASHALSYFRAKLFSKSAAGNEIKADEITEGTNCSGIQAVLADDMAVYPLFISSTRKGFPKEKDNNLRSAAAWATPYMESRAAGTPVGYPLLAHYKVHRAIIDIPQRMGRVRDLEEPLSGYEQSLDGGGNFRGFFAWFREMEDLENELSRDDHPGHKNYHSPELDAVRQALQAVLPGITNIRIRRAHQAMVGTKNGVEISVAQLSDGEKCYMALVGDIASRLARLNVQKGYSAAQILNAPGIVLIDELDLHLHTKWQQEAIRRLPAIFPNIQFIITTHSLALVRELDLMQKEGAIHGSMLKYFSLYEAKNHSIRVEEASELANLRHFPAAELHMEQDMKLLRHNGYELP